MKLKIKLIKEIGAFFFKQPMNKNKIKHALK